jgi:phosphomannomutase
MPEPIISVSGLRGVLGEDLTPAVAMRYACALAADLPPGDLVIARDGRATGPLLADVIRGSLAALGRNCWDAGVAATPTVGVLIRSLGAAGGLQISASHNPPQYNGLKAFGPDGRVVPARVGERVLANFRADAWDWAAHDSVGLAREIENTVEDHWALIRETVDVEQIRGRKFRVLLDANHGSGSVLGRYLLKQLGCDVTLLGETPDGQFAHTPEPTAENLAGVLAAVREAQADVGFCQDPDADRLAVIDAEGNYLGEEFTLAMCVDHALRQRPGPIVTNCSTSRMSQDLAAKYGAPFHRAAVGEANVVDVMLAQDAVLGGEGNGGVIDPRVVLVRDSFVGMAQLLDAMSARRMSIAALAAELPQYAIHKTKIALPAEQVAAGLDALAEHFADATTDRLDGLRLDWPDAWLLVRASNTEPIVRAIAEAKTVARAEQLCEDAARVLAVMPR